jgi:hypothetical protein
MRGLVTALASVVKRLSCCLLSGRPIGPPPATTGSMLLALALLLAMAWVFGFTVFHVANFAIHILLLLALVALVVHFVRPIGPRSTI